MDYLRISQALDFVIHRTMQLKSYKFACNYLGLHDLQKF